MITLDATPLRSLTVLNGPGNQQPNAERSTSGFTKQEGIFHERFRSFFADCDSLKLSVISTHITLMDWNSFVLSGNALFEPQKTFLDLLPTQNSPTSSFYVGDHVDVFEADTGRFVMRGYVSRILASGQIEVASELVSYGYLVQDRRLRVVPFCTGPVCGPCDPAFCRYAAIDPAISASN